MHIANFSGQVLRVSITLVSAILLIIGYLQSGRDGLLIGYTSNGEPIYPVSSGSEDGDILAFGFMAFLVTFIASLMTMIRKKGTKAQECAYWFNLILLSFFVFLVERDSSLVDAAALGDFMPLLGVTVAFLPSFLLVARRVRTVVHENAFAADETPCDKP